MNVVLTDEADFAEVKDHLESEGLDVRSQQPELGTLTGTVDGPRIPALLAIDGVLDVEPETTVDASDDDASDR